MKPSLWMHLIPGQRHWLGGGWVSEEEEAARQNICDSANNRRHSFLVGSPVCGPC